MTVDLQLYDRFLAFLESRARGEGKAITSTALVAVLGLADTDQSRRHLRACAQHAIRSGHLVCAANRGYYVPATRLEAETALSRLTAEAHALLDRVARGKRLAAQTFGPALPNRSFDWLPLFDEVRA